MGPNKPGEYASPYKKSGLNARGITKVKKQKRDQLTATEIRRIKLRGIPGDCKPGY